MTLREAAEKALEAMENNLWAVMDQAPAIDVNAYHAAIVALRAALAEPDGWRQCAKGQKTTHYCGLLEEAVKTEREACAAFLETGVDMAGLAGDPVLTKYTFELLTGCAAAIRARGEQ